MFFYASDKRYNQFSQYLHKKYGAKVYKVTINAGFGCPNRDGTKSTGGCIFCDETGSFSQSHDEALPISEQLRIDIDALKKGKFKPKKFIAYLQSFSNTYGDVNALKSVYDASLNHEDVIGLSIGTRPDCVDEEKIDLISSYAENKEVWIEYGLQTSHNKTLGWMNRHHSVEDFIHAVDITINKNIKIAAHVILGLPGETWQDMMKTAEFIADSRIDGVKLHALCVLKNTPLEKVYKKQNIKFLSEDEYVELSSEFIRRLPPNIVIHRITGNGLRKTLVEPSWMGAKFDTLNKIDNYLAEYNAFQGDSYSKRLPV